MTDFIIKKLPCNLTSNAGLALVGSISKSSISAVERGHGVENGVALALLHIQAYAKGCRSMKKIAKALEIHYATTS